MERTKRWGRSWVVCDYVTEMSPIIPKQAYLMYYYLRFDSPEKARERLVHKWERVLRVGRKLDGVAKLIHLERSIRLITSGSNI